MGVLPLQFLEGESAFSLDLDGRERYDIRGLAGVQPGAAVTVTAKRQDGSELSFQTWCRLDSETDADYYRNSGVLPFVLRQLMAG
jgi:aconitate hydratase